MKYIKLFENNSINIEYDRNTCWIIDGDLNNVLNILNKLIDDYMKDSDRIKYNIFYNDLEFLISDIKLVNINLKFDGMMLFSKIINPRVKDLKLSFKFLKNFNDVEIIINQEKCTLLGELKMENGKVVLDTSGDIIRTKKYNL